MSEIDTSAEAVERLAKRLKRDIDWRPESLCAEAAATLRALVGERSDARNGAVAASECAGRMMEERDAAQAEAARLREALEMIAGRRQCIDNLLSNSAIAQIALDK